MILTNRQAQILLEASGAKISGRGDPDVEALIQGGYFASRSGAIFQMTELGRAAVQRLTKTGVSIEAGEVQAGDPPLSDESDEYCPDLDESEYLICSLLDHYPRTRLRGRKGELLRELMKIRDERLPKWEHLTRRERIDLTNRAKDINKLLAADGSYSWNPNHRARGATSRTVDHGLDDLMIRAALASADSLGAALRSAIQANRTKLGEVEIESAIRRLRRKIKRQGLAIR